MMLKNRVLLVTNVSQFAGHGLARVAPAEGAVVLAQDKSFASDASRRSFEVAFPGTKALAAQGAGALADEVLRVAGRIDALVNNDAFPALRAKLADADMDQYRAAFETMAVRPLALTQKIVPLMQRQGHGRVVFVSSAAPLRGIANYSLYVSTRAATLGLVQSLAKELGRDGITVNAVGSNYVENPDYFPPSLTDNPEAMRKMTAQIPLGRLGKPEELAAAICFLCSDGAGFITGHTLPHAGGWA